MILPTHLPGLVGIALPTPFAVGAVNTYLAEGDPLTLIDCGVNSDESYQALVEGLADCHYTVRDIQRIIITHHHVDHIGMAARIVAESGAQLGAHPHAVRWLQTPREARQTQQAFTSAFFRQHGVPSEVLEVIEKVDDYLISMATPTPVDFTINEGDSLRMAEANWQVYHTPGHAGDLICLYQPESRTLVASDHLIKSVSSNPLIEDPFHPDAPRPQRLLDYLRELERIAALEVVVAYSGHGEPILDTRALIAERLAMHARRAEKIYDLFDGQPRSLWEITRLVFPKTEATQAYLMLSEIVGHLDLLEQQGRISQMDNGTHRLYTPLRTESAMGVTKHE